MEGNLRTTREKATREPTARLSTKKRKSKNVVEQPERAEEECLEVEATVSTNSAPTNHQAPEEPKVAQPSKETPFGLPVGDRNRTIEVLMFEIIKRMYRTMERMEECFEKYEERAMKQYEILATEVASLKSTPITSTDENSKTLKVSLPKSYSGSDGSKAQDFIVSMEDYFEYMNEREESRLVIAQMFLIDGARNWWTEYKKANPAALTTMSWEEFKKVLTHRFMPQFFEYQEGIALKNFSQTGSLQAYVREFNSRLTSCKKWSEWALCCTFMGGLKNEEDRRLLMRDKIYIKISELLDAAERLGEETKGSGNVNGEHHNEMAKTFRKKDKRPWNLRGKKSKDARPNPKRFKTEKC